MKILLFALSIIFLSYTAQPLSAQENPHKTIMQNSPEKLILTPFITNDSEISDNMYNIILSRLNSGIEASGELCGNDEDSEYKLQFDVRKLEQSVAGTVPPMVITKLQITLNVIDDRNIHGTHIFNVKGSGETELASYDDAYKNINFRTEAFRKFINSSKDNVKKFYEQEIDVIVSEAKELGKKGKTAQAIELLSKVPKFATKAWEKANKTAAFLSRQSKSKKQEDKSKNEIVTLPAPPPIPHLPTLPSLKSY